MKKNDELFCSVCGVSSKVKKVNNNALYGAPLCEKHRDQYRRFGKFMDSNQRGVFDPNEIRIKDDYFEIDTYDQYGNITETYICDLEDLSKLELNQRKWRTVYKLNKPYLFTGNQKSKRLYFHRIIMDSPEGMTIDHIDGNTLNNRKFNLRSILEKDNHKNVKKKSTNTSGIRGVSLNKKEQKWVIDFTYEEKRYYFKHFDSIEEAVYLRYLCETTFLKEFRYTTDDKIYFSYINKLSEKQKSEIEEYFKNKINTSKEGV